ncbi:MAG TPA: PspC domain-containing protein [Bacteroidia bacterium]|nr:PspC domain-containing protein [Bacteroidia bacterium]
MNKTLTINLAGLVFNIEENAYQLLKDYLAAIKNQFKNEEGCDEIVADIEARLAELLKAKTHAAKQVLVDADIHDAINVMGKPSDFEENTSEEKQSGSTSQNQKTYYTNKTRRVFRDGDNKVLGGVCSGIASYFDTDPLWIRLALVVLFFGFGSGLLLYIILWIIIPEAKTTAEKLEMRGDPIDINTISQTIKEEAEQLKNRVQDFGNGVKNEFTSQRSQSVGNKIGNLIYTIFHGIFKVISKIFGVLFVLFGTLFFVALLLVLFNVGKVDGLSVNEFSHAFTGSDFPMFWFKTGLAMCVGIPLCMIVYKGLKLVLGIKTSYRWLNLSTGVLWLVGLVLCLYLSMTLLSDFSEEAPLKTQIDTHFTNTDTLFVKGNNNYQKNSTDLDFYFNADRWLINNTVEPSVWWSKSRIKIITSENDSVSVFMIKTAAGKQKTEASLRAKNINYAAAQQGSVLLLDNYFSFTNTDKFRHQNVDVLIKLPKNKIIYLDNSLKHQWYDVENINGIGDAEMSGKYWKMTENGLTCLSCTKEELMNNKDSVDDDDEHVINIHDSDAQVHINKNGIEVNAKDAHIKISSDGIKVEEKKK